MEDGAKREAADGGAHPLHSLRAADEDDLLQFQDEFFSRGQRPSASVSRGAPPNRPLPEAQVEERVQRDVVTLQGLPPMLPTPAPVLLAGQADGAPRSRGAKSRFAARMAEKRQQAEAMPTFKSVFGQIKEKDIGTEAPCLPPMKAYPKRGFPEAFHRSVPPKEGSAVTNPPAKREKLDQGEENKPALLDEIDKENAEKLQKMSREEIIAAQKELTQALDPSLIEALRRLGRAKQSRERLGQPLPSVQIAAPSAFAQDVAPQNHSEDKEKEKGKEKETDVKMEVEVEEAENGANQVALEEMKLAWIKEDDAANAEATSWRFDFTGALLPSDADLPVHAGLHHHGKESTEPGYSLEELFVLARSQVASQRAIALQTLGAIVRNAKALRHSAGVNESVMAKLGTLKIALYLRSGIDDHNATVVAAAVTALHSLLVSPNGEDEAMYALQTQWYRGHEVFPALATTPAKNLSEEHHELASQDLVKAMLKMDLLPRLRYLLEVARIPSTVAQIFDILIRIARHSAEAARELSTCPRLVDTLRREFIDQSPPVSSVKPSNEYPYGSAQPKALQIIRLLCQSARQVAEFFIKEGLIDSTKRFLVMEYEGTATHEDVSTTAQAVTVPAFADQIQQLFIEAVLVWRTCVDYGLNCAIYIDMFPVLARQLLILQKDMNQPEETQDSERRKGNAASLFALFASLTHAAAVPLLSEGSSSVGVCWANVSPLLEPASALLLRVSERLSAFVQHARERGTPLSCPVADIYLLSSIVHTVAAHFQHSGENDCRSLPSSSPSHMAEWNAANILPLLNSEFFALLLDTLASDRQREALTLKQTLLPYVAGNLPSPPLPMSWKAYAYHGYLWNCLLSICRMLMFVVKLHPQLGSTWTARGTHVFVLFSKMSTAIANTMHYKEDEQELRKSHRHLRHHHRHIQTILQYHLISFLDHLAKLGDVRFADDDLARQRYHHAVRLVPYLLVGDELYLFALLSSIITHKSYLSLLYPQDIPTTEHRTINEAIRGNLLKLFETDILKDEAILHSACFTEHYPIKLGSQYLPVDTSPLFTQPVQSTNYAPTACGGTGSKGIKPSLAYDWPFIPLAHHYHSSLCLPRKERDAEDDEDMKDEKPDSPSQGFITSALFFIVLLEKDPASVVHEIPVAIRLHHVMKVFMIGNSDLLFDNTVSSLLKQLLRGYVSAVCTRQEAKKEKREVSPATLRAEKPIIKFEKHVGTGFYNFLVDLLGEFTATSFGNPVFAQYIFLFLHLSFPKEYRKLLWNNLQDSPHLLSLANEDAPPFGIEGYLYPLERDTELLAMYENAIASGKLRPNRNKLLYWIAIHHLSSYVFHAEARPEDTAPPPSTWEREQLLCRLIESSMDKYLYGDVLSYTVDGTWGSGLPAVPMRHLNDLLLVRYSDRLAFLLPLMRSHSTLAQRLREEWQLDTQST